MEALRKLRIDKDLTQKQIADMLGIDRTTYSKYEAGASEPPIATLIKLSKFYDVTVGYLVGAESMPKPAEQYDSQIEEIIKFLAEASNDQLRRVENFAKFTLSESQE